MTQTKQAVKPAPDWISALKLSAPAPALELQLNVRISADLDARLQRLAGARKITQAALVRMLLLESSDSVASLWENTHMSSLMLRDAL